MREDDHAPEHEPASGGPEPARLEVTLGAGRAAGEPADGRANRELCRFLAETLDVARRDVTIVTGEGARHKTVQVGGVAPGDARRRLGLDAGLPSGADPDPRSR